MRRTTFFKMMLVAIALVISNVSSKAQILIENFDYTVGSTITSTAIADPVTGWLGHSSAGTANMVVTNGLTFTGYAGSGIGGAAYEANNGEDINKPFTGITSGVVYTAFLVRVDACTSAGYFFHYSTNPAASNFFSRLWVNGTANGIGLGSGTSAPASYIPVTTGTTVMVVLKHDFSVNTTSLYILNTFPATEPVTPSQTISETYSAAFGSVCFRQFHASQRIVIDGIRVATTWAEASAAPSETPKVATPTFSAIPGFVTTSQDVAITTTTPGSTIYYTIDSTDPNNTGNGTLYTTPISVTGTTEIRAIAYAPGFDPSSISTAKYTFPTDMADISALRAAPLSGFYRLTGEAVLTFQSAAGKAKYIQDASAGILIYDGSGKITTAYNSGDGIKNIYCTLSMYNGMLELIPFADPGVANSVGNVISPVVVSIANLANYQAQLVKVKDVTITGTGNYVYNTLYAITDVTAGNLRTAYSDLDYITTAISNTPKDITGVVYNYSLTEVDLVPRSLSDIVSAQGNGISKTVTDSNIYASKGNIVLTAGAGESVQVFNATGQRLVSKIAIDGLNTIPVSAKGVVLVKVGDRLAKVIM